MNGQSILRPNDRTPLTGLYVMVWEDTGKPIGQTAEFEYRLTRGGKVPPTNKPGQGFIFLMYITPNAWKERKKARQRAADLARAKMRAEAKAKAEAGAVVALV